MAHIVLYNILHGMKKNEDSLADVLPISSKNRQHDSKQL